jgi:hypothetical protein
MSDAANRIVQKLIGKENWSAMSAGVKGDAYLEQRVASGGGAESGL